MRGCRYDPIQRYGSVLDTAFEAAPAAPVEFSVVTEK
jgi:hypothetical protein